MSKPLVANPMRAGEASAFHRAVFARFGNRCALCGGLGATDAAHVVSRVKLGPLRYADPELARPLHRVCHVEVDSNRVAWPAKIVAAAVAAHNRLAKVPIHEEDL